VIRKVSENFVPVAVNLYKLRKAKDAGGELFRSVQRQKDQYQGIWIVSPEGRVLAGHHDVKDHQQWPQEVLATLEAGLKAFGSVELRRPKANDPLPLRGVGLHGDSSATLAVYTRCLHRERPDGPPVLDSLTLSAKDLAGLVPPEIQVNANWPVPDAITRQFCRALSPSSDQSTMPRPEEVTKAKLIGHVVEVKDTVGRVSFKGEIHASHRYEGKLSHGEARIVGTGTFDPATKRLLTLLLVFEGTHRAAPPYDKPREMGAVIEWASARPMK
jgi:hypothetical protein